MHCASLSDLLIWEACNKCVYKDKNHCVFLFKIVEIWMQFKAGNFVLSSIQ